MSESVPPGRNTRGRLLQFAQIVVGAPTVALLVLVGATQASAGTATAGSAAGAAVPTASAASATVTSVAATATALAAQPVAATSTTQLSYGDKGAKVTSLQKRLKALHYDVGAINGTFGYDTLHAVYAFQKVQRITVDGVVGAKTWKKLADPRVLTPKYKHKKATVEVNLKLRVLTLTKNGKVVRIVDASPGKSSTPTVTGNFTITRRINGWRTAPLGKLYRPNYFYNGYAVHGSGSVPTYAASHGCVRVTNSAMDRLWSKLSVGEKVYVYKSL